MKKMNLLCGMLVLIFMVNLVSDLALAANSNPMPGISSTAPGFTYSPLYRTSINVYAKVGVGSNYKTGIIGNASSSLTRAKSDKANYGEHNNVIICSTEMNPRSFSWNGQKFTGYNASTSLSIPKLSYHTVFGEYSPEAIAPSTSVSSNVSINLGLSGSNGSFGFSNGINMGVGTTSTKHAVSTSASFNGGRYIQYSFDYKNFQSFCSSSYFARYLASYLSRSGATNADANRRISVSVSFGIYESGPKGSGWQNTASGSNTFGIACY